MPGITIKTEVKSCPFCSSEKIKVEQMERDNEIKVWVCWCGNCGALGPVQPNWAGAIAMWNLRRSQKSLLDALEVTKRFLEHGPEFPYHLLADTEDLQEQVKQALAQVKGE